ncbi:MAG: ABC transporter ATP-binding protein [Anaerolineales bacterium]|jgi:lipopolysaccharide transport system ATP-binding protein
MSDLAIRVEDLGKRYHIGPHVAGYRTLRETLLGAAKAPFRRFSNSLRGNRNSDEMLSIWALRHVNFEVRQGEVLGIIGRNGAGKSTLLKLLSRITEPTEGMAAIRGRVGSLLEVGTGFHPELTGRENIFLNGAILGMKRAEISRRFDDIVAFAEVEKFIDTPVKRYSSGMYLRLAFAVAAHLEPEILLIDEVLAVGDAAFQRKCLGKMSDIAHEGRTVLFVSHNMSAILRLTNETIVIEKGNIVMRAPSVEAVDYYMTSGLSQTGERIWSDDARAASLAPFRPVSLRVLNDRGTVAERVFAKEGFNVEFTYELGENVQGLRTGIYLFTARGEPVFTSFDTDDPQRYEQFAIRKAGRHTSRCHIPAYFLNEGTFVLGVNASVFQVQSYFTDAYALTFSVDGTAVPGSQWQEPRRGPVRPALQWEIVQMEEKPS